MNEIKKDQVWYQNEADALYLIEDVNEKEIILNFFENKIIISSENPNYSSKVFNMAFEFIGEL